MPAFGKAGHAPCAVVPDTHSSTHALNTAAGLTVERCHRLFADMCGDVRRTHDAAWLRRPPKQPMIVDIIETSTTVVHRFSPFVGINTKCITGNLIILVDLQSGEVVVN